MRIINAMFGRKRGGIEQAFLDYSRALIHQGDDILALAHPEAAVLPLLTGHTIPFDTIRNYGQWDIWSVSRLRRLIRKFQPDIIITHGNRATILLHKAAKGCIPVVGVCHNYSLKHLLNVDALLTITDHLRETVIQEGYWSERVFTIPNMISISPETARPAWRTPPVIGTMGRFVAKKGFDVFIRALAQLKAEGIKFQALLGGEGEEKETLQQLSYAVGVEDSLTFTGWIEDKNAFYQACDIFCLPSLHEPFGIVLLEALMEKLPVVTSASEGPREIVTHQRDALLVPVGDYKALADALKQLLLAPAFAATLSAHAREMVVSRYSMDVVGKRLHNALSEVL